MRLVSMLLILVSVATAQAQFVFNPSFTYSTQDSDRDGVTQVERASMIVDLKFGYKHASGLFLGAMYSMNDMQLLGTDDSGYSVGPTVGFSHMSGFYGLFTYHIMSEFEAGATTLSEGMGPQVDIGWVFPLTSMFSMGPQFTYKSLTYDKEEVGGVENTVETVVTTMTPYFTFWFKF